MVGIEQVLERDLPRPLPRFQRHRLGRDLLLLDAQRHLHILPRGRTVVADLGQQRGRRLDVRHAVLDAKGGDPRILGIRGRDVDDLNRGQPGELVGTRQIAPIRNLLVAENHDPLPQRRPLLAGSLGFVQGARHTGRAIDDLNLGQRLQGAIFGRRVRTVAGTGTAQRDDGHPAVGRQLVDEPSGPLLGLLQQRSFDGFEAHAQAVVDD